MIEFLTRTIHEWGLTWTQVLVGFALSVVTFIGSIVVVTIVLIKLPANYFHSSHEREFLAGRSKVLRVFAIILKNIFGLLLVALGIIMSLPGVPGQGVLTILLGVMLLDFPGKRDLETRLVSRPRVFSAVNKLRARFDKPPLVLD